MLHHPFVDWDDLLSVGGQVYSLYVDAFHACILRHVYPEDFYMDLDKSGSQLGSDSDSNSDDASDESQDENYPLADFEVFAHHKPRDDFPYMDVAGSLGY